MSTPHEESEPEGEGREARFVLVLRALAAVCAVLAIASLWSVERARVPHDLQLAVESSARPGETLAVRAFLFRDVDSPQGPTLAPAEAEVRLLDARSRTIARTELTPTALATLDGAIALPSSPTGALRLEARARYEGHELVAARALEVTADAPLPPTRGREAGPLQQLSVGRLRVPPGATPPAALLPRVIGGACVPEQPCRVLVWMGDPGAALAARPGPRVDVARAPEPAGETSGLVSLEVVVHGPDAELTLEARRGRARVAERTLRLPVGLGEVGITTPRSLLGAEPPLSLTLVPPPGRSEVIVDVFVAGRWRASHVVPAAGSRAFELPVPVAPPGLVRVQARTDRFTGEGASARVLRVREPGRDARAALTALARAIARDPTGAQEPTAAWADALPQAVVDDPDRAAAFLLAPLEQQLASVPIARSGRPEVLAEQERRTFRLRFGVAGALALSALLVAMSIARRGLSAADEAQAILERGREVGERATRRERFRERARVLFLVLAVALAFLAGAILIAAKPLWF